MTPGPPGPGVATAPSVATVRTGRPHKVGILGVALAAASFVLPFASISTSRIATGTPYRVWEIASPVQLAAMIVPWLVVLSGSLLRTRAAGSVLARGLGAGAAVPATLLVSGALAGPATAAVGPFARYSLGAGVWLAVFATFVVVVSARRESGVGSAAGWFVSLLGPISVALCVLSGRLDALGILVEYRNLGDRSWPAVGEHIAYAASAMGVATLLGVALGVLAFRNRRAARPIFGVASAFQTIPGLALIGILVVPLASLSRAFPALRRIGVGGLGWAPVVLALTMYALLAIVRNTYAGLESVPPETVDAGRGMGMTGAQLVRRVQMPLALPIVFSGVRTSSQQTIGNATLGAFVAAGGLGPLVFLGIAQQSNDLVLLGSIALVALALTVDAGMRGAQALLTRRQRGGRR